MVCVTVEVKERAATRRARIIAGSVERALVLAGAGRPGRGVRLLFAADAEPLFAGRDGSPEGTHPAAPGEAA